MKWLARAVALLTLGLLPTLAAAQPTPTPVVKIKWPGTLMIGDTPCGEAYLSIHKTGSGREYMWHIDDCQPLEDLVSGNNPVPTPRPTATPVSTVIPGDPQLCPDGFLTEPASKTDAWYGFTVDVPPGVTKRFCAPVMAPLAKPQLNDSVIGPYFSQITFSWYDVSDQDCGQLNVHVDAVDGPSRPRGGTGFSASGNYYYYGKIGSRLMPEQTAPGVYVMTLVGGDAGCHRYRIAWKAN